MSTQPPNGCERTNNQAFDVLDVRLTRARTMGKLSSHTHECPRCGMALPHVGRNQERLFAIAGFGLLAFVVVDFFRTAVSSFGTNTSTAAAAKN